MTTEKQEDNIEVVEEKDGSVTVELPENLRADDDKDDDAPSPKAADDAEDADHPDDSDSLRQAKRERRKAKRELAKRTNVERVERLQFLERQNKELADRIAAMERKSINYDLSKMGKDIQDEQLRLNYWQAKMKEATDKSNGAGFIQAHQEYQKTQQKIKELADVKDRVEKAVSQRENEAPPKLKQYAQKWMSNNSWFDPSGKDEDSQIASLIDKKLSEEGWDPTSADYWEELDNRLQKRLPHLYTRDQDDDEPRRSRPRSAVTASGRELVNGSSRGTFVLSPEQVRAMKEAGMWDDPQKRNRMIKRYAQEARNTRSY